ASPIIVAMPPEPNPLGVSPLAIVLTTLGSTSAVAAVQGPSSGATDWTSREEQEPAVPEADPPPPATGVPTESPPAAPFDPPADAGCWDLSSPGPPSEQPLMDLAAAPAEAVVAAFEDGGPDILSEIGLSMALFAVYLTRPEGPTQEGARPAGKAGAA